MPRIYITYRPEDSTRHEVERIYERMAARYGAQHILRTAAGGNADAAYLADLVNDCDALIVVIGRFWLAMLTEDGRRVIDDPDDYQHIELMTALAREDMWVTVVFTDGAQVPKAEELPPDLQSLLQRDRLDAPTLDALDKELDALETRISFAEVEEESVPNIRSLLEQATRQNPMPQQTRQLTSDRAYTEPRRKFRLRKRESYLLWAALAFIVGVGLLVKFVPPPTSSRTEPVGWRGDSTYTPVPAIKTPTPRPTRTPSNPTKTPASSWRDQLTRIGADNINQWRVQKEMNLPVNLQYGLFSDADNQKLIIASSFMIQIYDLDTLQVVKNLSTNGLAASPAFWDEQNHLAWLDNSQALHVWDMDDNQILLNKRLRLLSQGNYDLAYNPGNETLVLALGDTPTLQWQADRGYWDRPQTISNTGPTYLPTYKLTTHAEQIAFSLDKGIEIYVVSREVQIRFRDTGGQILFANLLPYSYDNIQDIRFDRNNLYFGIIAEDGKTTIYQLSGYRASPIIHTRLENGATAIAFSRDSSVVAIGDRLGQIHLYSLKNKRLIKTILVHSSAIHSLDFSPDGKLLATVGADRTVLLWGVSH